MNNEYDEYDEIEERRMFYGDYKNDYPGCETVKGAYDPAYKTIVVRIRVIYRNGED